MCGIIAGFNYKKAEENVNEDILEQFQEQRGRGTEGFGSVFIDENKKIKIKRATNEIKAIIDLNLNPSKMILMHHRMPTSSDNKILQTHPILVENDKLLKYKYLVVHNGVISNSQDMKKIHEDEGFKYSTEEKTETYYKTFNDSESLAIEVARYIENSEKKDTTIKNEIRTKGSAAFIALQINKETDKVNRVYYGRNELNPLKIKTDKAQIRISSEEKNGTEVKENILYSFQLDNFNLQKKELKFKKHSYEKTKTDTTKPYNYPTEYPPVNYIKEEEKEEEKEKEIDTLEEKTEAALDATLDNLEENIGIILEDFQKTIRDENKIWSANITEWIPVLAKELQNKIREAEEIHSISMSEKYRIEEETEKQEQEYISNAEEKIKV